MSRIILALLASVAMFGGSTAFAAGHGSHGNGGGGYSHGGGHGGGFRGGPGVGFGFGSPGYVDYGYDNGCVQIRKVWTPRGWRLQQVQIC